MYGGSGQGYCQEKEMQKAKEVLHIAEERAETKGKGEKERFTHLNAEFKGQQDQIRSVAQSCPTLCDPMNHSTARLPVHHQLPEFTQTHVH